jgi:hypothetical protein
MFLCSRFSKCFCALVFLNVFVLSVGFNSKAVFKNYDHDKDGFISHAEFEAIAGNFPFIDSFAVLDADQSVICICSHLDTVFFITYVHTILVCFISVYSV